MAWRPPGKDCGACGAATCEVFLNRVRRGEKELMDCVFYHTIAASSRFEGEACHTGRDILGTEYDFILDPLPGEVSARKIILPFRPDLVEKWEITVGDIVVGRPTGAGCPVQHVLSVLHANPVTGLLTCLVVGPGVARNAGGLRTLRPTTSSVSRGLPGRCGANRYSGCGSGSCPAIA